MRRVMLGLLALGVAGCGIPVHWLPRHGDPAYVDGCKARVDDPKECGAQPPRNAAPPDHRTPADTVKR